MGGQYATPGKFRKVPVEIEAVQLQQRWEIQTREGTLVGQPGDWLITGVEGEQYPCANSVFLKTYEPVDGVALAYWAAAQEQIIAEATGTQVDAAGGPSPQPPPPGEANDASRAGEGGDGTADGNGLTISEDRDEDAEVTARFALLNVLAMHGGERLTVETGGQLVEELLVAIVEPSTRWAFDAMLQREHHGTAARQAVIRKLLDQEFDAEARAALARLEQHDTARYEMFLAVVIGALDNAVHVYGQALAARLRGDVEQAGPAFAQGWEEMFGSAGTAHGRDAACHERTEGGEGEGR